VVVPVKNGSMTNDPDEARRLKASIEAFDRSIRDIAAS
jgi:hypothetical protein